MSAMSRSNIPVPSKTLRRSVVEALEARRLLSVAVSGSVVEMISGRAYPIPDALVQLAASPHGAVLATTHTDSSGGYVLNGFFSPSYSWAVEEFPPPFFVYSAGETGVRTLSDNQTVTGMTFYNEAAPADLIVPSAQAVISPSAVTGHTGGTLSISVENQGEDTAIGKTDITLYASAPGNTAPSSGDQVVGVAPVALHLLGGKSKSFHFKFSLPATLTPGSYALTAAVNTSGAISESNTANNGALASGTITVAAPVLDLGVLFTGGISSSYPAAKGASVSVILTNTGNVPFSGPATLTLSASTDTTLDSSDVQLKTISANLRLNPGEQKAFHIPFHGRGPQNAVAPGAYYLITTLASSLDSNSLNNTAISTTAAMFG